MSEAILETQGLCYRYPDGTEALRHLDLRIRPHCKLGVLGANGSGKTTLFLCLNGTLEPQAGRILLHDRPAVYGRRALTEWRQRVGIVFQNSDDQLIAGTVEQDIALGPLNLGFSPAQARAKAGEIMQTLGLESLKDRPLHVLSHGKRKLVAIAGVLAMEPEVILLDEPAAGLDPASVERLLAALETIHRRGATLLISTHNMDFAYEWADEAVILSAGKPFRQEAISEVFSDEYALREARLRPPIVLQTARRLQALGILAAKSPIRSQRELLERLSSRETRVAH